MRKIRVVLLAIPLLVTLSACQLLDIPQTTADKKPEGMNDYDYAVESFELALDEVQEIQEVLYAERWLFNEYSNRPVSCDTGSGAQFNIHRMTPRSDRLEGPTVESVAEAHKRLGESGFSVGEIRQTPEGRDETFVLVGEQGTWRVGLNSYGAWSIFGSTRCIDVDDQAVWKEMNQNGFIYVDNTEWALFPHERLPIRHGETPAPSPTPYPASPTYGRPRPTSTQYFPPTTPPTSSQPEQTP